MTKFTVQKYCTILCLETAIGLNRNMYFSNNYDLNESVKNSMVTLKISTTSTTKLFQYFSNFSVDLVIKITYFYQ